MDTDFARLRNLFMTRVGPDWAKATRTNRISTLDLKRGQVPWEGVSEAMSHRGPESSLPAFVAKHVRNSTHTYYSFLS
eukprot:6210312-Pleurochrysis_carterae.AAC.1